MDAYYQKLMEQMLVSDNENTVCSPINLYIAFAMLAETSDGNTRQQILDMLGAQDMDTLRKNISSLWKSNYADTPALKSVLANSLWLDGEETIPAYYESQGRHYMAVMDIDEIFYCCLYGNNEDEVIISHLYRDREYEQEMIYLEREFWHDYILTRIPPPYTEDGSLILESLRRRLGAADKTIPAIQLDNDLSATMLRYLRLQEQRQQVETRVKTLDTEMQQLKGQMVAKLNGSCMAVGEYGGTQYTISYNPVSRTGITKDNLQKLKLLHPDIYDEYVTVSESRRFSIKAKAADEAA